MREYQLQFTTSKIGERKKRSTLLNAIDRLRYPATRREYCHPHLVGAPHNRKSLFFIMSRICFGFFFTTDVYTHLLSSYGNGKEQQVTKAFYNCFANASFHRPNHHHMPISASSGGGFMYMVTPRGEATYAWLTAAVFTSQLFVAAIPRDNFTDVLRGVGDEISAQLSAHPLFGISCGSFEFLPPFSDS